MLGSFHLMGLTAWQSRLILAPCWKTRWPSITAYLALGWGVIIGSLSTADDDPATAASSSTMETKETVQHSHRATRCRRILHCDCHAADCAAVPGRPAVETLLWDRTTSIARVEDRFPTVFLGGLAETVFGRRLSFYFSRRPNRIGRARASATPGLRVVDESRSTKIAGNAFLCWLVGFVFFSFTVPEELRLVTPLDAATSAFHDDHATW